MTVGFLALPVLVATSSARLTAIFCALVSSLHMHSER
jgi:hypothetical protein